MTNKLYRYDIAILRLLCVAIVVFFHAYDMMFRHFSESTNAMYLDKYNIPNSVYLINIAMPMFVFISGFLFGGQLMRNEPIKFSNMVKSKFMRLMVPFFVFAVFFMFTQNAVSWKPFYEWTYAHLWFLPMLFWCFVITYFIRPLILNNRYYVSIPTIVVLFAISLTKTWGQSISLPFSLESWKYWIGYFALGLWFYKHEQTLLISSAPSVLKAIIIIAGLLIYFIGITVVPMMYGVWTVLGILEIICVIYSLWLLFSWIPWRNFAFTDFPLSLSACSFGIYIFHYWLEAHMVSRTAKRLLGLEQLAADHIYLFPLIFGATAFILSCGITWALLKCKIGRILIG